MRTIFKPLIYITIAAVFWSAPAIGQDTASWIVEENSQVGFIALQAGSAVEGRFERFTANIRFDPAKLGASHVTVVIDIDSVDSENAERDGMIRSKDLFDVLTWPAARFEADRFEATADETYIAHGRLTMRDVTRDVALPFSLAIEDHPDRPGHLRAVVIGEMTVMRLDYGVGQGAWMDTSIVANDIVIRIHLTASRPADG